VAVISDFQAEGWERALGVLRRRHDVVALHLSDPEELQPPSAGMVAFRDPETGERFVADTSRPEVRRALRAPGFAAAQAVFRKTRTDALALDTGASYERPLSAFFKARERRR
jgi:hypothetical protein